MRGLEVVEGDMEEVEEAVGVVRVVRVVGVAVGAVVLRLALWR